MFNPIIVKHFSAPLNVGELDDRDHEIHVGNPVCDDRVIMHIKLDRTHQQVKAVKYRAYGCATSIATASIFSDYISQKPIREILSTPAMTKESLLGKLEPNQVHCYQILDQLFLGLYELEQSPESSPL